MQLSVLTLLGQVHEQNDEPESILSELRFPLNLLCLVGLSQSAMEGALLACQASWHGKIGNDLVPALREYLQVRRRTCSADGYTMHA